MKDLLPFSTRLEAEEKRVLDQSWAATEKMVLTYPEKQLIIRLKALEILKEEETIPFLLRAKLCAEIDATWRNHPEGFHTIKEMVASATSLSFSDFRFAADFWTILMPWLEAEGINVETFVASTRLSRLRDAMPYIKAKLGNPTTTAIAATTEKLWGDKDPTEAVEDIITHVNELTNDDFRHFLRPGSPEIQMFAEKNGGTIILVGELSEEQYDIFLKLVNARRENVMIDWGEIRRTPLWRRLSH